MAYVQRKGENHILRSEQLPAIEIQIDPDFRYLGSASFILYEVAHVEQHHFIILDAERRVIRRLWFQFEGYLDNNTHKYDYSGMESLTLNGFRFVHNIYPMNVDEAYRERPTSDTAHVIEFFRDKGYTMSGDIISHRMVWLDDAKRNELMIIYSEVLDPHDRLAEMTEETLLTPQWSAISQAFQERSLASFKILS